MQHVHVALVRKKTCIRNTTHNTGVSGFIAGNFVLHGFVAVIRELLSWELVVVGLLDPAFFHNHKIATSCTNEYSFNCSFLTHIGSGIRKFEKDFLMSYELDMVQYRLCIHCICLTNIDVVQLRMSRDHGHAPFWPIFHF